MAEIAGLYMINDSDSEELKRKKINSNFNAILSGLTNGLGNGSTGVQIVFGGNGLAGSSHGYYNAVRDRLEVDRLFAEDMEAKYLRTDFLNVENGATIAGVKIGDGCVIADKVSADKGWVGTLLVNDNIISEQNKTFWLEAVNIDASKIKTGTLIADRIFVTKTVDGVTRYYPIMPSNDPNKPNGIGPEDEGYTGIDVDAGSIIAADSITAIEITTKNIQGTNGWINLSTGEFSYGLDEKGENFSWIVPESVSTPEESHTSEGESTSEELQEKPHQLSMSVNNQKMFTIVGGSTNTLRSVASNFIIVPEDKAGEYLNGYYLNNNEESLKGWAWIGKSDGSLALKKVTA